jgi:hypothetical protein
MDIMIKFLRFDSSSRRIIAQPIDASGLLGYNFAPRRSIARRFIFRGVV